MKKTAAVKLINQIKANRLNSLLKVAYEYGAATQATIYGVDDKTATAFAKKASSNFEAREANAEARRVKIAKALLALCK